MSFVNPWLTAFGVAFVALPIVLHLLRRRRPPVRWGAMRFLLEAARRQRRRMTVERWVLLTSRCLLVLLLAAVLGRPVLGSGGTAITGPRDLYLLLDNSLTAGAITDSAAEFDQLQTAALDALDGLDAARGDRAALVLLGGPAEASVTPPSNDLAAVRRLVQQAERVDSAADLAGGLTIVSNAVAAQDDAPPAEVRVLSGLRAGSVDLSQTLPTFPAIEGPVTLDAPADQPTSNVSVAAVEPLRSVLIGRDGVSGEATVRLRRAGVVEAQRIGVSLIAELPDGRTVPLATGEAVFDRGETEAGVIVPYRLPASARVDRLVLAASIDGDALPADDMSRRAVLLRESLRVGLVAPRRLADPTGLERFGAADWVRVALAPDVGGPIESIGFAPAGFDRPTAAGLDAAFVLAPDALDDEGWRALRLITNRGGLVVLTPAEAEGAQLWTDRVASTFGLPWTLAREPVEPDGLALAAPEPGAQGRVLAVLRNELAGLVEGVGVQRLLPVSIEAGPTDGRGTVELSLTDGQPMLVASAPQSPDGGIAPGLVAYLASRPEPGWTDLPARSVMVPLMQELVRQGVSLGRVDRPRVAGNDARSPNQLRDRAGIPINQPLRTAGVYDQVAPDGRPLPPLIVVPDTAASNTSTLERDAVEAWLGPALPGGQVRWVEPDADRASPNTAAPGEHAGRSIGRPWLVTLLLAGMAVAVLELVLGRYASPKKAAEHAGVAA